MVALSLSLALSLARSLSLRMCVQRVAERASMCVCVCACVLVCVRVCVRVRAHTSRIRHCRRQGEIERGLRGICVRALCAILIAVHLHRHACVRTGRERNMNMNLRMGSLSAVCHRLRNAHINSGRCTHAHACTHEQVASARPPGATHAWPRIRPRRGAQPLQRTALRRLRWGEGGGAEGGACRGRLGRLAPQTRGETGSARRRRRRAADACGGRVEEGAVVGAEAVGRRRARGDGGAAARADGKFSEKSLF